MENIKNTKNQNKIFLQNKSSTNKNIPNGTGTQTQVQGLNQPVRKTSISRHRAGSMLTIPTYTRKNLKLTNNVASLVKKYANYIFNELKLDKNKE